MFPKNLFRRPLPSDLLTAPACSSCNNSLSDDEEIFRIFVTSGDVYDTEAGRGIWDERVRPSLRSDRRGIRTRLREDLTESPILSDTGEIIGRTVYLEVNREAISRVLAKIGKGLYFLDTGEPLPVGYSVLSKFDEGDPENFLSPPLNEAFAGAKKVVVREGVITYWRNVVPEDPASTIIWVAFFNRKVALVMTQNSDSIEG